MFGIEVDSWEKLVSEFADMLDSSNMEAWPYVDLTDQRVGVHVDLNWGDPTCEEPLTGHELVEIEPKSSREGYEILAIPDGYAPLNIIPIGYPAEDPPVKNKWSPAKIHADRW